MANYIAVPVEEDKAPFDLGVASGGSHLSSDFVRRNDRHDDYDAESGHPVSIGPSGQPRAGPRRWRWARSVALVAAGLLAGWFLGVATRSNGYLSGRLQGDRNTSNAIATELPLCDRVMLFDWSSMPNGLGSTLTSLIQSAYIAERRNYTLLISRGANAYGSYYGLFAPYEPTHCRVTEDMYQVADNDAGVQAFHELAGEGKKNSTTDNVPSQVVFSMGLTYDLNKCMRDFAYGDFAELDGLPALDARHPLPSSATVPDLFRHMYIDYAALSARYLSLVDRLELQVDQLVYEMGLGAHQKMPTVGVHWRSGDKSSECWISEKISCTNVTRHCETAWVALEEVGAFAKPDGNGTVKLPSTQLSPAKAAIAKSRQHQGRQDKPRLLLMTAERDALDLFKSDEYCRRFTIEGMPQSGSMNSFAMSSFNGQSKLDRIQNAEQLLVQTTALVLHADAAVFGIISNVGRSIAFPRAGTKRVLEEKRIRSVDVYWHWSHYAPFAGACDGVWGPCFPHV